MSQQFKRSALGSMLILGLIVGCSSTRNKTEVVEKKQTTTERDGLLTGGSSDTQKAAADLDRNIVSTIEFEPGRRALSPEATAELNRAILEAKQRGEVDEINVVVWSDMEYPARKGQKLPKVQIDIAKERGENIEKYVDRMEPDADVKIHNMAEQPSTFANFLNTQDATIKNRLATMGVSADEENEDIKGRSSTALVFIKVE